MYFFRKSPKTMISTNDPIASKIAIRKVIKAGYSNCKTHCMLVGIDVVQ